MRVIHKYPIIPGLQSLWLPADAEIVHVGEQFGVACAWVMHDTSVLTRNFDVAVIATGEVAPHDGKYVGTLMLAGGSLVFHVFVRADAS